MMKTTGWKRLLTIASAFMLSSVFTGCGGNDETSLTAADYVEMGWSEFTGQDYEKALEHFSKAFELDSELCEAYTGLGWTRTRLSPPQIEEADSVFDIGIQCDDELMDSYAGKAITSLALFEFEYALENADYVVNQRGKSYFFQYDISFYWYQVYMVKVQALYHLGEYLDSYDTIQDIYPEEDYPETDYPYLYLDYQSRYFEAELLYLIELLNEGI